MMLRKETLRAAQRQFGKRRRSVWQQLSTGGDGQLGGGEQAQRIVACVPQSFVQTSSVLSASPSSLTSLPSEQLSVTLLPAARSPPPIGTSILPKIALPTASTIIGRRQKAVLNDLRAAGRRGAWRVVPQILQEARQAGCPLNEIIYCAAINSLAKSAKWKGAIALLTEMKKAGMRPNCVAYSGVVEACGRAKEHLQAQAIWQEMKQAGIRPDLISYSIAIYSFGVLQEEDGEPIAWTLLLQLQRQGLKANLVVYNAVLHELNAKQAVNLLHELKKLKVELNKASYNSAMYACYRTSDLQLALQLFKEMQKDGELPNHETYKPLIAVCCTCNEKQTALQLIHQMRDKGLQPFETTFNAVITCCTRARDYEKALALLAARDDVIHRPSLFSWNVAINTYAKAGNLMAAINVIRCHMRKAGVKPDVISFSAVMGSILDEAEAEDKQEASDDPDDDSHLGSSGHGTTISPGSLQGTVSSKTSEDGSDDDVVKKAKTKVIDTALPLQLVQEMKRMDVKMDEKLWALTIKVLERAGQLNKASALQRQAAKNGKG